MHIEPDVGIPLPEIPPTLSDFNEKVAAACKTIEDMGLDEFGMDDVVLDGTAALTDKEKDVLEQAAYAVAANPTGVPKALSNKVNQPAIYHQLKPVLDEFSHRVVENATQIRLLVTNKLLLESENPDPKIRLRALEMLGKITDVGLFTEKSEVTVNHRSSTDLVTSLREKIQKLMYPVGVQDAEVIAVNGEVIDVDKELGIEPEGAPHDPT